MIINTSLFLTLLLVSLTQKDTFFLIFSGKTQKQKMEQIGDHFFWIDISGKFIIRLKFYNNSKCTKRLKNLIFLSRLVFLFTALAGGTDYRLVFVFHTFSSLCLQNKARDFLKHFDYLICRLWALLMTQCILIIFVMWYS